MDQSLTPSNVQTKDQELRAALARLRQESLLEQIDLVQRTFPEIWADAERFYRATRSQPWEFGVTFLDRELGSLREKYDVFAHRHRPSHRDVVVLTDLFSEACGLAEQHGTLEPASALPSPAPEEDGV
jgi:hypothetical protein